MEAILDAGGAIEGSLRADGVRRALIELRLQLEPHQLEGITASGA